MRHSDTVHRAAAMFPCGDRPDRFPIRTRFFRRLRYCTGHSGCPDLYIFHVGAPSHLSLAVLYWKKLDKSILVYGKTGQQEILGI